MQRNRKGYIISFLVLTALLGSLFGASSVFAKMQTSSAAGGSNDDSAQPAVAPLVSMHTVNMRNVPAETAHSSNPSDRMMPWSMGVSPAVYAQRKAAAAHNNNAAVNTHPFPAIATGSASSSTPPLTSKFQGMSDSPSICPIWGMCPHPDMALATSPNWVFQGVNESWAVYNTHGKLQQGWPINYQHFFGVPNPPHGCDNQPYMVDVRAFYDPGDGRFWAAMLQDEGTYGYNNCPLQALYWIAVSQTGNPTGKWNVYAFDMARGTNNAADFTQIGFDRQAIYFSSNMLDKQTGTHFKYAEVFAADKAKMEAGATVTPKGFTNLKSGSTLVDSVQPVETEAVGGGAPGAELFINTFNINSGGGSCSSVCSGVVVWAFANPLTMPVLSHVVLSTPKYTLAPQADQPGCTHCIETFDTRIGATPVYNNGKISFAFETGVKNKTQVVPGVFWAQVQPTLKGGTIKGASLFQNGILSFTGDQDASYSAVMPDKNDNLFMVFNTMSHTIDPSSMYTARRSTDPHGTFETPLFLIKGVAAKTRVYYGDFAATSYDGSATNHVWFASEYTPSNGDWSTFIGETHF